MFTTYTCGRCGGEVPKNTGTCPHCSARLGDIKCKSCAFVGTVTDFRGDRCPRCGGSTDVSAPSFSEIFSEFFSWNSGIVDRCHACKQPAKGWWVCSNCGYVEMQVFSTPLFCCVVCILVAIFWTWKFILLASAILLVTIAVFVKAAMISNHYHAQARSFDPDTPSDGESKPNGRDR